MHNSDAKRANEANRQHNRRTKQDALTLKNIHSAARGRQKVNRRHQGQTEDHDRAAHATGLGEPSKLENVLLIVGAKRSYANRVHGLHLSHEQVFRRVIPEQQKRIHANSRLSGVVPTGRNE